MNKNVVYADVDSGVNYLVTEGKELAYELISLNDMIVGENYYGSLAQNAKEEGYPLTLRDGTVRRIGYFNGNGKFQAGVVPPTNKYDRLIFNRHGDELPDVDVYDVIEAFSITCPALQHAVKKMLCTGIRGHKDFETDIKDIEDSLVRAKQLHKQRVANE